MVSFFHSFFVYILLAFLGHKCCKSYHMQTYIYIYIYGEKLIGTREHSHLNMIFFDANSSRGTFIIGDGFSSNSHSMLNITICWNVHIAWVQKSLLNYNVNNVNFKREPISTTIGLSMITEFSNNIRRNMRHNTSTHTYINITFVWNITF